MKGVGKEKKSKWLSLPLDLALSSDKALVIEMVMEVTMPPNMEFATLTGVSEAPEGKRRGW